MVPGIFYVFLGLVVVIGDVQLSLLIMGPQWGIENYRGLIILLSLLEIG